MVIISQVANEAKRIIIEAEQRQRRLPVLLDGLLLLVRSERDDADLLRPSAVRLQGMLVKAPRDADTDRTYGY